MKTNHTPCTHPVTRSLATLLVALLLVLAPELTSRSRAAEPTATPTLQQRIDSLFAVKQFKDVAISPDGTWLAWVEEVPAPDESARAGTTVFAAELAGRAWTPRRITAGGGTTAYSESDIAWSPDSHRLAFLSDYDQPGQSQLYVADLRTGKTEKRTKLVGHLAKPRFAPGDDLIALLYTENARRATGPTQAAVAEVGVVGEKIDEQRLHLIDPRTGAARAVSPGDLYVYEYDWSPDGKQLAVIAANGDGNNNWYIARLVTLSTASGEMRTLLEPKMQIAAPRWSPDGRSIAFIGGLMSDEGANGGEIFVIGAEGGAATSVTPGLKASASWLSWQPSSRGILFTAHVDGASGILAADLGKREVTPLWTGNEVILAEGGTFGLSIASDHRTTALVRHAYNRAPEIWTGPVGQWGQRTKANGAAKPDWGEMKSVRWKSDGFDVQGWLMYPRDYDPKQRYPMIVSIHGGPASSRRPGWPSLNFDFSLLSGDGYFVFFPNPRGSFGKGLEFTRANFRDFGHGDLRDILAGVDHVLETLPIDANRLGVVGWSYGGFMTMWTVTQTHRFRAAVAGAGIANWQSYYGQNGIDQWLIPFFGASVYDDPDVYARSSPMNFIKNVRTPTLILVGEGDIECPPPQSFEFWRALKRLEIPAQLVIYAGEGHGIRQPRNRRDILLRSAEWLKRSL